MDFIIIGGGIGGLTTAISLKQMGFSIKVFEKSSEIRETGSGITLWSNAMQAFDRVELMDAIKNLGYSISTSSLRQSNGKILKSYKVDDILIDYPSVTIPRGALLERLKQQLEGDIELNKEFISYQIFEDKVRADFADGSSYEGKLLIGADGIHSQVRETIYANLDLSPPEKRYSGYAVWRGITTVTDEEYMQYRNFSGEIWGSGQRLGILPIKNNKIYWFAVHNISEEEVLQYNARDEQQVQQKLTVLSELYQDWHDLAQQLISKSVDQLGSDILYHPIYDLEPHDTWVDDRVLLVGDAAHATTPNMGQGACMAIEDGVLLSRFFDAKIEEYQSVFTKFVESRQPRTKSIVNNSWQTGKIGQMSNRIGVKLRNFLFRLMPSSMMKNRMVDTITIDIPA